MAARANEQAEDIIHSTKNEEGGPDQSTSSNQVRV